MQNIPRPYLITILIALVSLSPLMFSHADLWDGTLAEMAILSGDYSIIDYWVTSHGWYMSYYGYLAFDHLAQLTGIPWKAFINALIVISLLGLARETFLFLREQFELEHDYALIGSWAILTFPIWHNLTSTAIFVNVFCLWVFMGAVRQWYSNKFLSIALFAVSAQLFSLFSLAVGFGVCEFILSATRENGKKLFIRLFIFSALLLAAFIAFKAMVNMHGRSGEYNTLTSDALQYLYPLIGYCIALVGVGFLLQARLKDSGEAGRFFRLFLAIAALLFFAVLPYVAVGRPVRFFSFGSFGSRHALLTCIPLSFLLAVATQYVGRHVNARAAMWGSAFVLLASMVLLHQGYSHKAAALVFKDMLTRSFEEIPAPPSGYVAIRVEGAEPPRHVHNYEINMCLYKAYGKSAWMANGYWRRNMKLNPASLKELYGDSKGAPMCKDVTGDAYSEYVFSLSNYAQEGRFWYWYYYLASEYSAFNPTLTPVDFIHEKQ
ncbi:MAG: hypothetical protein ABIK45_00025 [Pseudomonadota bacterium]